MMELCTLIMETNKSVFLWKKNVHRVHIHNIFFRHTYIYSNSLSQSSM